MSRSALGHQGGRLPGLILRGKAAGTYRCPLPSSAEVKNEWRYSSASPHGQGRIYSLSFQCDIERMNDWNKRK